MIGKIGVVVPAHNEEAYLGRCLESIDRAVYRLQVPAICVVVLDSCTDSSSAIVSDHPSCLQMSVDFRNVGRARSRGFRQVLGCAAGSRLDSLWLSTTDADGVVPENWLTFQVEQANRGAEVILGTIAVTDWAGRAPEVAARFASVYVGGEGHPNIHGANFGISARAYLAAGGWPPLESAEDHALVTLVNGRTIVRTGAIAVTTSSRSESRAPMGFAGYLDALESIEAGLDEEATPPHPDPPGPSGRE